MDMLFRSNTLERMDYKDLQKIQQESTEQILPEQKKVFSAADKIRRKTSNLLGSYASANGLARRQGLRPCFSLDPSATPVSEKSWRHGDF